MILRYLAQHFPKMVKLLIVSILRLSYYFGFKRVPVLPIVLDIEPNNNCNFRCPHCQVTHWSKQTKNLNAKSFQRILNQFPFLTYICLQGMGEPFLNKQLIPMLKIGEDRNIFMKFTTNGSIMNRVIAKQLISLKNTRIRFSIDGATADVFEAIRVGGKFNKVCDNIKLLTELRGKKYLPIIDVWTIVFDNNIHQLPEVVRLAKELGTDKISIITFISDWGKAEMKQRIEKRRLKEEGIFESLRKARQVATEVGIDLSISAGNQFSMKRKCHWPWRSAYIASNGDVVPCCVIADSKTIKMGNVFEENFSEIWNSRQYQELRQRIKKHDLPKYCENCYRS